MKSFLTKIRRNLITEGQVAKYLIYSIGEIILVVLGILIALQINNWNEAKKASSRERSLLNELSHNLNTNIDNLQSDIDVQIRSTAQIHFLMDHMENKRPYHDSLGGLFAAADFAPDVILASSAFETLKSQGFDLIQSDTLRQSIINLFEITYPYLLLETKRLEDQLWPSVALPLTTKHFKVGLVGQFVPNDYTRLLEDQEYLNLLSLRRGLRKASTQYKQKTIEETQVVIDLIKEEFK